MVRKVKVTTKKKVPLVDTNSSDTKSSNYNTINDVKNNVDTHSITESTAIDCPTCIRIFIEGEHILQYVNNIIMRFNASKNDDSIDLQRVGYKLNGNNKVEEIDIAILHEDGYSVTKEKCKDINSYLISRLDFANVKYQFINFDDSYRNSAEIGFELECNGPVTEYITLEKGSIDIDLFSYLCYRYIGKNSRDIQSIRIPITKGCIVYDASWEKNEKMESDKKEDNCEKTNIGNICPDGYTNITIYIVNPDASNNVDNLMCQFTSAIGAKIYDHTEQSPDRYLRVINMNVAQNVDGTRFINSLTWVGNTTINVNN